MLMFSPISFNTTNNLHFGRRRTYSLNSTGNGAYSESSRETGYTSQTSQELSESDLSETDNNSSIRKKLSKTLQYIQDRIPGMRERYHVTRNALRKGEAVQDLYQSSKSRYFGNKKKLEKLEIERFKAWLENSTKDVSFFHKAGLIPPNLETLDYIEIPPHYPDPKYKKSAFQFGIIRNQKTGRMMIIPEIMAEYFDPRLPLVAGKSTEAKAQELLKKLGFGPLDISNNPFRGNKHNYPSSKPVLRLQAPKETNSNLDPGSAVGRLPSFVSAVSQPASNAATPSMLSADHNWGFSNQFSPNWFNELPDADNLFGDFDFNFEAAAPPSSILTQAGSGQHSSNSHSGSKSASETGELADLFHTHIDLKQPEIVHTPTSHGPKPNIDDFLTADVIQKIKNGEKIVERKRTGNRDRTEGKRAVATAADAYEAAGGNRDNLLKRAGEIARSTYLITGKERSRAGDAYYRELKRGYVEKNRASSRAYSRNKAWQARQARLNASEEAPQKNEFDELLESIDWDRFENGWNNPFQL